MFNHLHLFILNDFSDLCPSLSVTKVRESLENLESSLNTGSEPNYRNIDGVASILEYEADIDKKKATFRVYRNHPKVMLTQRLESLEKIYECITVYIVSHGADCYNICVFSARDRKQIDVPELLHYLPLNKHSNNTVSIYCDVCRSGRSTYKSAYDIPPEPNILIHMGSHRKKPVKQLACLNEASFLESAYMEWFSNACTDTTLHRRLINDSISPMAHKLMLITKHFNKVMFAHELKSSKLSSRPFPFETLKVMDDLSSRLKLLQSLWDPLTEKMWKSVRQLGLLQQIDNQVNELQTALAIRTLQKAIERGKKTILHMCQQTIQVYMNNKMREAFESGYNSIFEFLTEETCMEKDQLILENSIGKLLASEVMM